MKSHETLLKLHRFRAEEARRQLSALETMKAEMEGKIAELDRLLSDEARKATESGIGRYAYPTFAKSIQDRKENVRRSVTEIERQIDAARQGLEAAFRELKKYEIADETRRAREDEARARAEQAEADDRAIQRFARAKGEG